MGEKDGATVVETLTCGVEEFAHLVGVNVPKARELVAGRNRPPGFYVGKVYKVYRAGIEGWLADLSATGQPVVRL